MGVDMEGSDAGLVVSILAGFVSGGVGGAVVAHHLRRQGEVRCIVPRETHRFESSPDATRVAMKVTFTLRFYNEREVGTSLSPLYLDVLDQGTRVAFAPLKEDGTDQPLRFMDLPSQASVWTEIDFWMEVPADTGMEPQLQVRWRYPDGKVGAQIIPTLGFEGSTWDESLPRM